MTCPYSYPQYWADALVERGFRKFKYKDLPDDLKNKTMLRRAASQGFIRAVGKYEPWKGNRCVWMVTRNGS